MNLHNIQLPTQEFEIFESEDGLIRVDVNVDDKTVWLKQKDQICYQKLIYAWYNFDVSYVLEKYYKKAEKPGLLFSWCSVFNEILLNFMERIARDELIKLSDILLKIPILNTEIASATQLHNLFDRYIWLTPSVLFLLKFHQELLTKTQTKHLTKVLWSIKEAGFPDVRYPFTITFKSIFLYLPYPKDTVIKQLYEQYLQHIPLKVKNFISIFTSNSYVNHRELVDELFCSLEEYVGQGLQYLFRKL
jgi:hypothetical protein